MRQQIADRLFSFGLLVTQIVAVVFYAIYQRHVLPGSELANDINANLFRYPYFQDIHIMVYVGFGFLLTFIHRYRLSSLTMCFWIAALAVQYYFLFSAFWRGVFISWDDIIITPDRLILGEVSAAAVLIAVCAIIGKANNVQYLIITIASAFLYTLNEELVIAVLGMRDVGGSAIIHAFGAFYGIGITWMLNFKKAQNNRNLFARHSSFTTAMIGTLFLWCFWPSFNAALATTPAEVHIATLNTYFSIIGSVISAYFTTTLLFHGKFNMDHVINATLAGGVCMGAGADLLYRGYVAYIVGSLTGIVSTLLFEYSPRALRRIGIYDIAGVFNLHGIPGMLGGLYSAIFRAVYIDNRGAIQVAGTFISIGIGFFGGIVIGFIVRGFNYYVLPNQFFNDMVNVEFDDPVREKLKRYDTSEEINMKLNAAMGPQNNMHLLPNVVPNVAPDMEAMSLPPTRYVRDNVDPARFNTEAVDFMREDRRSSNFKD